MYLLKSNICHHKLDVQETNVQKKKESVSHSSTGSEIIALDAGFRMGRYPCY